MPHSCLRRLGRTMNSSSSSSSHKQSGCIDKPQRRLSPLQTRAPSPDQRMAPITVYTSIAGKLAKASELVSDPWQWIAHVASKMDHTSTLVRRRVAETTNKLPPHANSVLQAIPDLWHWIAQAFAAVGHTFTRSGHGIKEAASAVGRGIGSVIQFFVRIWHWIVRAALAIIHTPGRIYGGIVHGLHWLGRGIASVFQVVVQGVKILIMLGALIAVLSFALRILFPLGRKFMRWWLQRQMEEFEAGRRELERRRYQEGLRQHVQEEEERRREWRREWRRQQEEEQRRSEWRRQQEEEQTRNEWTRQQEEKQRREGWKRHQEGEERRRDERRRRNQEQERKRRDYAERQHQFQDREAFPQWKKRRPIDEEKRRITVFPDPPSRSCRDVSCARDSIPWCKHSMEKLYRGCGHDYVTILKEERSYWHPDRFAPFIDQSRADVERKSTRMFQIIEELLKKQEAGCT
ncbi:hypothetical protein B0J12DRAFT_692047 [Macrophomina phaseolina]|uniref:Uncharacterized protein n=1 Tax=Macrophomina phaseolina TaxID=35725 RepID=A0ABQ8FQU9_9PEZI|nr:hypothetical protein B0J12DRAFT_692047 [Macrophomina phaseolina]